MKISPSSFLLSLIMLLLSCGTVSAASVSISPIDAVGGKYRVSGTAMDGVAGLHIKIAYDMTMLSNPQVIFGSMLIGSTIPPQSYLSPGLVQILAFNLDGLRGSGDIATISFDSRPGAPRPVIIFADLSSTSANKVEAQIVSPSQPSDEIKTDTAITDKTPLPVTAPAGETSSATATTGAMTTTTQPSWLGTVTFPSSGTPGGEQKEPARQAEAGDAARGGEPQPAEPVADRVESQQTASGGEEKKEQRKTQLVSHISMIERFRQYEGERTPAKLLAILKETEPGYSQYPPVVLSDGTSTAKVSISLPADTPTAPNVAISREGQMVSFGRGENGTWVIEIRPRKDVSQVILTYFFNDQVTEIPLTVAPRLESFRGKPFSKLTEADFVQFIAGRIAAKELQPYDLNKDSVLNHIDDFIFAANYLLQAAPLKNGKEPAAAKPSQEPPAGKQQEKPKPAAEGAGNP